MREERTEVLVAGAGPVGLWTALLLAEAGIEVAIIDREERTAARSYACALHPRTMKLLAGLKLSEAVLDLGQRVQTVAFYDGQSRHAELKMSEAGGEFPFLVILPQGAFERVLEERLRQAGVTVNWNHRFDSFQSEPEAVVATVEELGGTATGYIVPHWETIVRRKIPVHASFLIGADGANSLVRQRLGIENEHAAGPYFFAAYEFESEEKAGAEVRVVLDASTTNVLWPLSGNKHRWTFQLVHSEMPKEFPQKERRAVHVADKIVDERVREYVQKVAKHRAPWFTASVKEVTWCTEVIFEHRLARQFGKDRCWLLGDAAHQAGPVGVQSMNAGLDEAAALADCLRRILRENGPLSTLAAYERERLTQWRRTLGLNGGLKPQSGADSWVRDHASRLLPCIPGMGEDLEKLAGQLKLELA